MRILFLCVANAARSQIAEGLARAILPASVKVASGQEKADMLRRLKSGETAGALRRDERKGLQKIPHIELDKRTLLLRVAAAWVITVRAATMLAAMIFFMLRGTLLP